MPAAKPHSPPQWRSQARDAALVIAFAGEWTRAHPQPAMEPLARELQATNATTIRIDTSGLADWDSVLASTLLSLKRLCQQRQLAFDESSLPEGMAELLALATALPVEPSAPSRVQGFLETWRTWITHGRAHAIDPLLFSGELLSAFGRLLRGRANIRWSDFWFFVQEAGPRAIAIISLVSVLAGMILAYLGAVQLRQFGAQIYVANLVSIGMTREMGALMTAIIMAGRTGAAYAAQLGTMQANEEIDALKIMGINTVDFLALPRALALLCMLPLLTLYADVLGMFGGSLIAASMDIGLTQYVAQTQASIGMTEIFAGLFKSVVFAAVIAQSGCHWGLQSGRSSTDVGRATTKAVVSALVWIIITDSVINVLYDRLGI